MINNVNWQLFGAVLTAIYNGLCVAFDVLHREDDVGFVEFAQNKGCIFMGMAEIVQNRLTFTLKLW